MTTSLLNLFSSIGIVISSLGVIAAIWFGVKQISLATKAINAQSSLATKAINAQSFITLHQLEIASRGDGEDGMAVIAALAT